MNDASSSSSYSFIDKLTKRNCGQTEIETNKYEYCCPVGSTKIRRDLVHVSKQHARHKVRVSQMSSVSRQLLTVGTGTKFIVP